MGRDDEREREKLRWQGQRESRRRRSREEVDGGGREWDDRVEADRTGDVCEPVSESRMWD